MIVIRIMGGLGNQMFQYALYRRMLEDGYEVRLDDRDIRANGNSHNGFELLNIFSLPEYHPVSESEYKKEQRWFLDFRIRRKLHLPMQKHVLMENGSDFISYEKCVESDNRLLHGYWQSEEYFSPAREILLKEFEFQGIDEKNLRTAEQMASEPSVSLHIRRGDYLLPQFQWLFGNICTDDYYKSAVRRIQEIAGAYHLYVFTNDIPWVKQNFSFADYTLVDWNTGVDSYKDMYLMSKCRSHIIANSSFSWWGAWLGQNPDKIVIAPSKWLNQGDCSHVVPEPWVRI